jgi:hypothetical protein
MPGEAHQDIVQIGGQLDFVIAEVGQESAVGHQCGSQWFQNVVQSDSHFGLRRRICGVVTVEESKPRLHRESFPDCTFAISFFEPAPVEQTQAASKNAIECVFRIGWQAVRP